MEKPQSSAGVGGAMPGEDEVYRGMDSVILALCMPGESTEKGPRPAVIVLAFNWTKYAKEVLISTLRPPIGYVTSRSVEALRSMEIA